MIKIRNLTKVNQEKKTIYQLYTEAIDLTLIVFTARAMLALQALY